MCWQWYFSRDRQFQHVDWHKPEEAGWECTFAVHNIHKTSFHGLNAEHINRSRKSVPFFKNTVSLHIDRDRDCSTPSWLVHVRGQHMEQSAAVRQDFTWAMCAAYMFNVREGFNAVSSIEGCHACMHGVSMCMSKEVVPVSWQAEDNVFVFLCGDVVQSYVWAEMGTLTSIPTLFCSFPILYENRQIVSNLFFLPTVFPSQLLACSFLSCCIPELLLSHRCPSQYPCRPIHMGEGWAICYYWIKVISAFYSNSVNTSKDGEVFMTLETLIRDKQHTHYGQDAVSEGCSPAL